MAGHGQGPDIHSAWELSRLIRESPGLLAYFGAPDCSVCAGLRPKVLALLDAHFPELRYLYVDCAQAPELAAQVGVFSVPTIIVYLDGKEFVRRTRVLGITELREAIQRPYALLFGAASDD